MVYYTAVDIFCQADSMSSINTCPVVNSIRVSKKSNGII